MANLGSTPSNVYIRPVSTVDSPALSRICLLTGDAGVSAEPLHNFPELLGLVYAEPYAQLSPTFGFVMVDRTKDDAVVGYVLGTPDTRAFEARANAEWYPRVRAKYANPPAHPHDPSLRPAKEADARYVHLLHNPPRASVEAVTFSPAHLHIDILPEYQRQGWGRRLIARAVRYLREQNGLDCLWLGLDPRNVGAKLFYERLGFKVLDGAPAGTMGLIFEDFNGEDRV
ncbi:acyl-CoA N-acyltransferase [Sparassis crispa]|uniref:Acyl-CoA N-acyltransferase n=1 Tax=Sparassis crispa TaxID=139825 RepID=A0A401GBJ9_9APHY|nr:acyl-CoA N-acyltransferase [Sparassis crispa]GBE79532.1 acyl-CoA N-acyltransferase [Sparassis crispa]